MHTHSHHQYHKSRENWANEEQKKKEIEAHRVNHSVVMGKSLGNGQQSKWANVR